MPTPKFISLSFVLKIHQRQIKQFGGTLGLRDEGLLESALAQPQASFAGQLLHPTIAEQASAYLYHLAKNHPFIDGNKRTALATMDTFLRINGHSLALTNTQVYELVINVAQGKMSKSELAEFLESVICKSQ